jgi:predicted RNase H-like HicB family nuclease
MERIINLHIEKLPEGVYLATSDDVQGLVAQGRTIWETIEIARDVARKLLEAQNQDYPINGFNQLSSSFDIPVLLEM